MAPSKGRQPSQPDVARAKSIQELQSSNSTTAAFLGGKQKPWMGGVNAPVTLQKTSSTTPPTHQSPGTHSNVLFQYKELPSPPGLDRGRFPAERRRRGGTKTYPSRQETSSATNTASPVDPPQQAASCSLFEPPGHTYGNLGNPLPSPSPSVETRRQSTTIVDLEDDSLVSGSKLSTPLEELLAQHGGIDAVEKKLRGVADSTNQSAFASPVLDSNIQNGISINVAATNIESPPAYATQSEGSHSSLFKDQTESIVNHQRSKSTSEPNDRTQIPPRSASWTLQPAVNSSRPPNNIDPMNPAISFEIEMQSFHMKVVQRLGYSMLETRPGKDLERQRLNLLRDACDQSDCFYICLHQQYVRDFIRKSLNQSFMDSSYQPGLEKLSSLLLPNEVLSADALKWFADFPLPLESLIPKRQKFQSAHKNVLQCLAQIGMNFDEIRAQCKARGYPPLIDELFRQLNVDSFILQQVIFRAILREIWPGPQDHCFQLADDIFSRSCRDLLFQRSTNWGADSTEANSRAFIHEYSRVTKLHREHAQPPTPLGMPPTPPTPPPQQASNRPLQIQPHHPGNIQAQNFLRHTRYGSGSSLHLNTRSVQQNRPLYPRTSVSNPIQTTDSFRPFCSTRQAPTQTQNPGIPQWHSQSNVIGQSLLIDSRVSNQLPFESMRLGQPSSRPFQMQQTLPSNVSRQAASRLQHQHMQRSQRPVHAMLPSSHPETQSALPPFQISSSATQRHRDSNVNRIQGSVPDDTHFIRANPHLSQTPVNPTLTALHQALARSPTISTPAISSANNNGGRLFRFIKHVIMSPQNLDVIRKHISWAFEVDKTIAESWAKDTPGSCGAPPTRYLRPGSCLSRIRCINVSKRVCPIGQSDWPVADNIWPGSTAIILNDIPLEIRKKSHHGRDLPIDATPYVKEGINNIQASLIGLPDGDSTKYSIGVEIIEVTDEETIKNDIPTISMDEGCKCILNRLRHDDPDIQIVGSQLILDVTDPFTSSIFEIPVRGLYCSHLQCFDRDIFLLTRNSKNTKDPCGPDEFRCPVCNGDARPQSLVIDGYFMHIREELQKQGRLDAKAIVFHQSGDWEIKEDEEATGEQGDGSGKRPGSEMRSLPASRGFISRQSTPREVIEIDD